MGTDLLINLALGDLTDDTPVVLPADRADEIPLERLLAVWCEAEPRRRLYDVIVESRLVAVAKQRPLAIFTRRAAFDLSVVGVCQRSDVWWMPVDRQVNEPIAEALHRYDTAIEFCPLGRVVLILGLADWLAEDLGEYVRACGELAKRRPEIVGLVWLGRPAVEAIGEVTPEDLADLPGPPKVEAVDLLRWDGGA